jgi:pimeloyl-ACP methyl ester carboxylesterase
VLDAARAARAIRGARAGRRVVVFGHSQGGHAALFAGQLARSYAPALDVRGVVASAPASELSVALTSMHPQTLNGVIVAAIRAWSYVYRGLDLSRVFTPIARRGLSTLGRACVTAGTLLYDRPLAAVFRRGWERAAPWPELLRRNSPGHAPTKTPILLVQGSADGVIPASLTTALHRRLCAIGDRVRLALYPGATHGDVLARSAGDVARWLRARLAGAPAATDC